MCPGWALFASKQGKQNKGFGLDLNFSVVWMSFDTILHCGWKRFIWGNWVFLSSLLVPESSAGIIPKTIEVSLYKEGNSFGFVLRG